MLASGQDYTTHENKSEKKTCSHILSDNDTRTQTGLNMQLGAQSCTKGDKYKNHCLRTASNKRCSFATYTFSVGARDSNLKSATNKTFLMEKVLINFTLVQTVG